MQPKNLSGVQHQKASSIKAACYWYCKNHDLVSPNGTLFPLTKEGHIELHRAWL